LTRWRCQLPPGMSDTSHRTRERYPPTVIEVDHSVVVLLRPEAKRRDVPVVRLIRDVLDVLGGEPGLVGAILDSGDGDPGV
jgi:hypothetical protein